MNGLIQSELTRIQITPHSAIIHSLNTDDIRVSKVSGSGLRLRTQPCSLSGGALMHSSSTSAQVWPLAKSRTGGIREKERGGKQERGPERGQGGQATPV